MPFILIFFIKFSKRSVPMPLLSVDFCNVHCVFVCVCVSINKIVPILSYIILFIFIFKGFEGTIVVCLLFQFLILL